MAGRVTSQSRMFAMMKSTESMAARQPMVSQRRPVVRCCNSSPALVCANTALTATVSMYAMVSAVLAT